MIILNGLWNDFTSSSPLYKILEEITSKDYTVELCSFFGFKKMNEKSDLVIFVCGECLDIEALVKQYGDYVDIFISFQPDKIFNINNKKVINIQGLLPVWNNSNYENLNEQFKCNFLKKKDYDFSIVVSNSGYNQHYYSNLEIILSLCINDLNLMQTRIDIANRISNENTNSIINGGRAFNNRIDDKIEFIRKSKFNICFENVKHRYYITEKIFDSYLAGCIPIYAGDKFVNKIFDDRYFVNCLNYKTNQLRSLDEIKQEAFEKYQFIKEMNINDLNIYNKMEDYVLAEQSLLKEKLSINIQTNKNLE